MTQVTKPNPNFQAFKVTFAPPAPYLSVSIEAVGDQVVDKMWRAIIISGLFIGAGYFLGKLVK